MQQKSPSKGTFIALIVIVIATLLLFFYYKGKPSNDVSSLETMDTPESIDAQEAGNRVLSLLNTINGLKIDDSIFKTAVFISLIDYTNIIPERPVGRPNPFAPISGIEKTTVKKP